jgi:integral membrane protein (TIGR00529 family)
MEFILHISAIIRISLIFVFVLICIRKKLSLGNAFLIGALLLGILFGLGPKAMVKTALESIIYPKTVFLAIIVSLILVLSSSMEKAGQMRRLLANFQGLVSNPRIKLVVFPALIGLLPMPGGAVFSAPMVKELGKDTYLAPDMLSFVNYWFRHIWEYWWPLYPGVLLAITLADINLWTFVTVMSPLTIVSLSLGYLPIKGLKKSNKLRGFKGRPSVKPFVTELTPILIVIFMGLGIGIILSFLLPHFTVSKEAGLVIALCVAIGWIWHKNDFSKTQIRNLLADPHIRSMIYMVITIFIFKGMMEGSRAVEAISNEFRMLHVPLVLITMALPFLVGGVVGITVAFVGTTFPILIPLIYSFGETQFTMAYIMLAIGSGFIGVILSPLHICLLLSNQYFGTTLTPVYKHLWLPSLCFILSAFAYFGILRWVFL